MDRRQMILFSSAMAILSASIIFSLSLWLLRCETPNKFDIPDDGRKPKVPTNCDDGIEWLPENAVVYIPDFFTFRSQQLTNDTDIQKFIVAREPEILFQKFHTLIIDCPARNPDNYSESDLNLVDVLSQQKRYVASHGNITLAVWFQFNQRESADLSACVDLAKAANAMHPGTITGIIITEDLLLAFAEDAPRMGKNRTNETNEKWWEVEIERVLNTWERYNLKTGLAVSAMYCFSLENAIPALFMERFASALFMEKTPSRVIVANQTPFLTLSDDFQTCRDFLKNRIFLQLVIAENDVPRRSVSQSFCLV